MQILKHVGTRWLSIVPAVERVVHLYDSLLNYSSSLTAIDIPQIIKDEFCSDKYQYYLALLQFICFSFKIFDDSIKKLESSERAVSEVYDIMNSVKINIESRIEMSFYGFKVNLTISKWNER